MKIKFIAIIIAIAAMISSTKAFSDNEERNVSEFSEISLRVSGKLYLEQGDNQKVEIEAKSSTLERIITEVEDGKLIIRFPKNNNFWNDFDPGKITIHITVADINGLNISGSGTIIAEKKISTKNINLAISGSGDIIINDLTAENVKASIAGSGDISVEEGGTANELSGSVSGSGDIKTAGFKANNVNIRIAGSGDASVYALETLKAKVAGSGNIYYNGNPSVDSSVAGSGSVRKIK